MERTAVEVAESVIETLLEYADTVADYYPADEYDGPAELFETATCGLAAYLAEEFELEDVEVEDDDECDEEYE